LRPKQTSISLLTILLMIAALGAATYFLEIPALWMGGVLFVLVIIALMLSRRQAPPGSNRLLLGLTIIAIVIGLAINGALAVRPEIPEELPEEVIDLPAAYDTVPLGSDQFVVFYSPEDDTTLNIIFESISSIEGYWAYDDAWVEAEQALRGTYDADPPRRSPDWGDTISTTDRNDPTENVMPTFTVDLPLEEKHLYDEIELSARMIVSFPEPFGSDLYEISERRASRRFTLFVASPEDRVIREQYDSWSWKSSFLSGPGMVVLLAIGGFGAIFTLWGLAKIRGAGGYGTILPSLLGKMGVVVADTSLIPKNQVQGTLPKGVVIVGKIRPSSPAERAALLPGDIITEADGKPIDSHRTAKRIVERWKRGEEHMLVVLRGDQNLQLYIQM
jgi:hypothetical protein